MPYNTVIKSNCGYRYARNQTQNFFSIECVETRTLTDEEKQELSSLLTQYGLIDTVP